jgi:hypothetical protein
MQRAGELPSPADDSCKLRHGDEVGRGGPVQVTPEPQMQCSMPSPRRSSRRTIHHLVLLGSTGRRGGRRSHCRVLAAGDAATGSTGRRGGRRSHHRVLAAGEADGGAGVRARRAVVGEEADEYFLSGAARFTESDSPQISSGIEAEGGCGGAIESWSLNVESWS